MTKPKPKDQHLKQGRPSKYKPEYCQQLITHMSQGLSFETFAAVLKVNQDTIHEWSKVCPEFSEAKKEAWAQNQLFWERIGLTGMAGKMPGFNATIWIFNMKNRFKWRDLAPVEADREQTEAQRILKEAMAELDKAKSK